MSSPRMMYVTYYGASNGSIVVMVVMDNETLFECHGFSCVFENILPGHVVFLEYMSNPLQATTTTTTGHW
jgi:hypothetical protein